MPANNALKITELDFDTIKDGIKGYIKTKPEFLDYNFEGSTISLLLDILAYNTYQNAFLVSMAGNEMFLDSALLRDSVVSRAKMLGYTPRSAQGSSNRICLEFTPDDPNALYVTVPKDTEFTASVDGIGYTWVTPQSYTIYEDSGVYEGIVTIVEGVPLTHKFIVNAVNPIRYILPNENVDTRSIEVIVRETGISSNIETFNLADNILDVNQNSAVYFIQETDNLQYEIYFGDGVLGKQLENNNVVEISYRVCNGSLTNNINEFSIPATVPGATIIGSAVEDITSGGDEYESIESIKFNAPRNFETQNRAVLDTDYKSLVLREFGDIKAISIWGGETNDPPIYGKVFIAARPENSTFLSQQKKNQIKEYLKQYNIMGMDIEFIDPTYLYLVPTIKVYYDSSKTSLSPQALSDKITTTIQNYEINNLGTFEKNNLKYSIFSGLIDDTDISIVNNVIDIVLEKRFVPNFNTSTTYTLTFQNKLEKCKSNGLSAVSSTGFVINNNICYLDDDGNGNIQRYYIDIDNITKIYDCRTQGTIDYNNGIIKLISFNPVSAIDDQIEIQVTPVNLDISTSKYQLMLFASSSFILADTTSVEATIAKTVNTVGNATQINETAIGTVV